MALGKRLEFARELRGIKKAALARMVGMTSAGLGILEKRDSESSDFSESIANVLAISHHWLVHGTGDMYDTSHNFATSKIHQVQSTVMKYGSQSTIPFDISNILRPILGTIEMGNKGFNIEIREVLTSHAVAVPNATPTTRVYQIIGSQLERPLRDGWHIACDENAPLIEGEYLLIENNDSTWIFAEYLFGRDTSIEVDSLSGVGRMSLQRSKIKTIYPMIGIYPPSQRTKINH
jgi:transcriptional regulator with XRE-family HTH domain